MCVLSLTGPWSSPVNLFPPPRIGTVFSRQFVCSVPSAVKSGTITEKRGGDEKIEAQFSCPGQNSLPFCTFDWQPALSSALDLRFKIILVAQGLCFAIFRYWKAGDLHGRGTRGRTPCDSRTSATLYLGLGLISYCHNILS